MKRVALVDFSRRCRVLTGALGAFIVAVSGPGCGSGHDDDWRGPDTLDTDTMPPDTADGAPLDGPLDPGRVTWRRLNRDEYNRTVRDLLGTQQRPADDFPSDDTGYGFDNIAEVMSISPLHLEVYERAAGSLVDEVLDLSASIDAHFEAEFDLSSEIGGVTGEAYNLWSNGILSTTLVIPEAGEYRFRANLYGQQAGPELVRAGFAVDGQTSVSFDVDATNTPTTYERVLTLTAGPHEVGVSFLNDFYDPANELDRNLIIDWLQVTGPVSSDGTFGAASLLPENPALWSRHIRCSPAEVADELCARATLEDLATKAWRRPVEPSQVDGLMAIRTAAIDEGLTPLQGLRYAMTAVLMSPRFVFRTEFLDAPLSETVQALDGFEIATRLSYLLWSSMPDDTLFEAARNGELDTAAGIEAQVRRMLNDPKAVALIDNFGGQWLYIRNIDNAIPDPWVYPDFDEDLRASMREEMRRFFASFLENDRSMLELLTSSESFIDERLASHYGVSPPLGGDFASSSLSGTGRRGLLGQAGLLTALSTPFRTSIVRRGRWVLNRLLCWDPGDPPPGVEGLIETEEATAEPKTLRERMEQHYTDPVCANCHKSLDPIGFALENFDGIGGWRDTDNGYEIDASGQFPDGETFDGSDEMIDLLAHDPRLPACMVEQVFTYALGRGVRRADEPYLEMMTAAFAERGYLFEELMVLVATSDPFRMRRGEVAQ